MILEYIVRLSVQLKLVPYTRSYQGYMDDIRVYNVAPNELKQVYFNTNTYDVTKI